ALDQIDDVAVEPGAIADEADTYAAAVQLIDFLAQVKPQERHEIVDLAHRALPVFEREAVQGQIGDADRLRALDRLSYRFGATGVSGGARQPTRLRPTPVAVHDDGDVLGRRRDVRKANGRGHRTHRRLHISHEIQPLTYYQT